MKKIYLNLRELYLDKLRKRRLELKQEHYNTIAFLKNNKKQYFYLRSLQLLITILGLFIWFLFLRGKAFSHGNASFINMHDAFSLIYYFILLLFISNTIRKYSLSGTNEYLLKNIIRLKWTLFSLSLIIFCISLISYINQLDYYGSEYAQTSGYGFAKVVNYHILHIGIKILVPDIGFWVITFLSFYLSQTLTILKELKEEQSLTI